MRWQELESEKELSIEFKQANGLVPQYMEYLDRMLVLQEGGNRRDDACLYLQKNKFKEEMMLNQNYKLKDQSLDFLLGKAEEQGIEKLASIFRKIIFDEEHLMLREARNGILGIHTEAKGAGTSLVREEDNWVLNFGFSKMSLIEIESMLSPFHPLEKTLKELCEEVGITLYYLQKNNFSKIKDNSFLRELVIKPPEALADDRNRRIIHIKKNRDRIVYIIKSLNGEMSSLDDCVALLQSERISSEEIFMTSLNQWLGSIRKIRRAKIPAGEKTCRSSSKEKYIN